jgi:hypothetical protein
MGIAECVVCTRVIGPATGGQNNGAHMKRDFLLSIFEVDRIGWAKFFTASAFSSNKINALSWIDAIFKRNGLSILHINRLAFAQVAVIGVGNFLGAFFRTGAAGDTFFRIDVSRALSQFDFKIALFAFNALHFAECQQLDVDVPADLDQFRRYNSHRAVIGGKGFVQLRHHAADGAGVLHQVDIEAGIGKIQGGLHSGDTAADHHNCSCIGIRHNYSVIKNEVIADRSISFLEIPRVFLSIPMHKPSNCGYKMGAKGLPLFD